MRNRLMFAAALTAMTLGLLVAQSSRSAEVQFKAAQHKQQVEGDLKGAIEQYKKIAQGNDRRLAAKALVAIGECDEQLGNSEARVTYERVVREFPDQRESVAEARKRLAALGGAAAGIVTRQVWTGEKLQGSISLDGRYISFTSTAKWPELALHDLANGTDRKLANESYPPSVISPDGKYVAYTCASVGWHVCAVGTEPGAKPRDLYVSPEYASLPPKPGAWSSDDKSILATLLKTDGTAQIAWIAISDGSIKVLKSLEWRRPGRPSLSPDGRYIAYSAHERADSPGTAIYVLRADGSGESTLVRSSGLNQDPVWTPDGTKIVFTSNRTGSFDLWSVAVHDGKSVGAPVLAKADIGKIQPLGFTRSGSFYYNHIQGGTDVLVADLEPGGGKIRGAAARLSDKFVGANRWPSWSPDGKFIAVQRFIWDTMGNIESGPGPDLVIRSLETGEEKTFSNLPSNRWMTGQATWFRDGKTLLLPISDQQAQISFYRLDLVSGEFKPLVTPDSFVQGYGSAALSLDETVVYAPVTQWSKDGGRSMGGVAAIDFATGRETPIFMTAVPKGLSNVPNIALSPDGRTLALLEFVDDILGLSLVNVDGTGYRRLYAPGPNEAFGDAGTLAWTKDGRSIFFYGQGRLMRIAAAGGQPEFAGLTGKGGQLVHRMSLSPDGSRIAISDGDRETVEVWALDNLLPVLKAAK